MPMIARDAVASDHLVYAWPFPIGPEEHEVVCGEDERVVMCPAWLVDNLLAPGRHRWRTPDPMRPVSAYFVLSAPVEVSFDMTTSFMVPLTGQPVRLRASGSLQVRCIDPALLIAQFVGLPFDAVNEGILRSVSRSVERMLGRLLARRVVMAGSPNAVTDPTMLSNIVEELVAYNPAAGAVFGIELVRMGHLAVTADDGSTPWHVARPDSEPRDMTETARGRQQRPTIQGTPRPKSQPSWEASGEIIVRPRMTSVPPPAPTPTPMGSSPGRAVPTTVPQPLSGVPEPITGGEPRSTDDITQPGMPVVQVARSTPVPGSMRIGAGAGIEVEAEPDTRGSIIGIGVGHIGSAAIGTSVASGEISSKVAPGARVLVPGPDGLMQSATVRQLLQGYYELEVGGSGETIWVPVNGVVPE